LSKQIISNPLPGPCIDLLGEHFVIGFI